MDRPAKKPQSNDTNKSRSRCPGSSLGITVWQSALLEIDFRENFRDTAARGATTTGATTGRATQPVRYTPGTIDYGARFCCRTVLPANSRGIIRCFMRNSLFFGE